MDILNKELFQKLINENEGFEVTLGFRNDVDHFIGGIGNKYWYFVKKGQSEDYYVCTVTDGKSEDVHYMRKKKVLDCEAATSGKTMELILSELAVGQKEITESSRKPLPVEVSGHPCSHYSFAFGERAYKISDEFGVTIEYSNLKDEESGFRLRTIYTGADIIVPEGS